MKLILFFIFLFQYIGSFCQSAQNSPVTIVDEVCADTFKTLNSYKSLPKFIRKYLDELGKSKFTLSKKRFNASDVNIRRATSRKLSYVAISDRFYILSYEHGGRGYHGHTIIFEADSGRISKVYNLITPPHKTIKELKYILLKNLYSTQNNNEI